MDLKKYIRDVPDFPKKGILFKDITTILNNKKAFKAAVNSLSKALAGKKIEYIAAAESRGFIFAAPLAYKLGCGFVPVRKPGKLPYKTHKHTYSLEYGTDTLEMHSDAFPKGSRVLVLDDLLATGGTALAMAELVKKLKGKVVAIAFLIELSFLNGREKLKNFPVISLIKY